MSEKREAKRMQEERFLDHIYEGYDAGQRYCFVLGAGASRASGIRTGEEMMREWLGYLRDKGSGYVEDCAQELGLEKKDYAPVFEKDHVLKNDDYFTLFDLRFAGKPNVAYAYLEREMEEKYPSYGYYPLAMLLSNTQNRLVITTNFDSLIEDALYTYTFRHPLVVGHESLASYIANDARHPVIAKIHRDLLFQPLNRKEDMAELKAEWEKPLRSALSRYIPIVVGYAGGDRTFMSLLEEIELNGIYWCHLGEPSDQIKEIVSRQNGYLVRILGFDEVMFQIGERFSKEAGFGDPCQYVQEQAEKRCDLYRKSFEEIRNKYEVRKDPQDEKPLSEDAKSDVLRFVDAMERYDRQRPGRPAEGPALVEKLLSQARKEAMNGAQEKAVALYTEVISLVPDNAEYYQRRSVALYKLKRYEEALRDDNRSIELEPDNGEYYNSRSATLYEMKRYEEALQDDNKSIELEAHNPEYYLSRGITLHAMKRYEEALRDKTEAIVLDGSNPQYYESRGITLHEMKRYEEALQDQEKAILLEPGNPEYPKALGVTLHELGRYEEALQSKTRAIKLNDANPEYYISRAATLFTMKQYQKALQDETKAIELDPSKAKYYENRAVTLHKLGRETEALADEKKAAQLS